MVKVACYGEMHSTVDNFFAKFLFIFELVCEILFLILTLGSNSFLHSRITRITISYEWHAED